MRARAEARTVDFEDKGLSATDLATLATLGLVLPSAQGAQSSDHRNARWRSPIGRSCILEARFANDLLVIDRDRCQATIPKCFTRILTLYRRRELKNESLGRFLIKPGPGREETPRLHLGHVLEALLRVVSAHLRQRAHLLRARARARASVRVGVRARARWGQGWG